MFKLLILLMLHFPQGYTAQGTIELGSFDTMEACVEQAKKPLTHEFVKDVPFDIGYQVAVACRPAQHQLDDKEGV